MSKPQDLTLLKRKRYFFVRSEVSVQSAKRLKHELLALARALPDHIQRQAKDGPPIQHQQVLPFTLVFKRTATCVLPMRAEIVDLPSDLVRRPQVGMIDEERALAKARNLVFRI